VFSVVQTLVREKSVFWEWGGGRIILILIITDYFSVVIGSFMRYHTFSLVLPIIKIVSSYEQNIQKCL
jgi:hypothetical protein